MVDGFSWGQEQDRNLSVLITISIVLEVLTMAVKQENELKGIYIGKEVKQSLFEDDMIVYIESPKESSKILE